MQRNQETSGAYGVRSMPTFMYFLNGKKKDEFSGAGEQQMRQLTATMVRESERLNVKVTKESLLEFYGKVDASKPAEDVEDLHGKCVKGAESSAKVSPRSPASLLSTTRE